METFISALLCAVVACVAAADVPVDTTVPKLTVFVPEDHALNYQQQLSTRPTSKSTFRDLFLKDIHDTFRHFLTSPIVVFSKSSTNPGSLDVTFVPKGLNALSHDPAYSSLHTYLHTPTDKFGLLFDPAHYFQARLFDAPVSAFSIPSNYKLGDTAVKYPAFLFVADGPEFQTFNFNDIKDVGKFNIFPTIIEPAL